MQRPRRRQVGRALSWAALQAANRRRNKQGPLTPKPFVPFARLAGRRRARRPRRLRRTPRRRFGPLMRGGPRRPCGRLSRRIGTGRKTWLSDRRYDRFGWYRNPRRCWNGWTDRLGWRDWGRSGRVSRKNARNAAPRTLWPHPRVGRSNRTPRRRRRNHTALANATAKFRARCRSRRLGHVRVDSLRQCRTAFWKRRRRTATRGRTIDRNPHCRIRRTLATAGRPWHGTARRKTIFVTNGQPPTIRPRIGRRCRRSDRRRLTP